MSSVIRIVVSSSGFLANDVGPIAVASDDADEYVAAVVAALEGVDFSNLSNIMVEGSENGLVVLDNSGQPLRQILWGSSTSSSADADWCNMQFAEPWWLDEVGVVPDFSHSVAKMSWLHRNEPAIWNKMVRACSPADYIRWRLVEGSSNSLVTSATEAERTGLWSTTNQRYSSAVLELIDRERDWTNVLPTVKAKGTIVGSLFGTLVNL